MVIRIRLIECDVGRGNDAGTCYSTPKSLLYALVRKSVDEGNHFSYLCFMCCKEFSLGLSNNLQGSPKLWYRHQANQMCSQEPNLSLLQSVIFSTFLCLCYSYPVRVGTISAQRLSEGSSMVYLDSLCQGRL